MRIAFVRRVRFIPALLLLAYVNCKEGKTEPGVATTIAANSGTTISGTAGAAVSPPPSVIVRDQSGNPFGGATVTFSVLAGGGSVTGASAVTDVAGVATAGGWTLGKTAGPNVLSANAGTLSVSFNATGTAGPAAELIAATGDNQVAIAGSVVPIPPAVLVQDANGNLTSGVAVTFTIGSGGGSVTGATATSNSAGIATVGSWTLGAQSGTNTLVASAAGAPSLTFRAVASPVECGVRTSHMLGSTTNGTLETNDCQFSDGSFVDFFSTTLPEANAYLFRQTAGFDAYLLLALADGSAIAENDDETDATTNSAIKALLPAGTYVLGASSLDPAITGNYTLSSEITPADNGKCELWFLVKNISTTQNIQSTDCLWTQPPAAPIYADGFVILLRAGQSITINMSSSAVDSYLELVRASGIRVAQNDNRDATTKDAQIVFTATVTDYYTIIARTAIASQTGAYTLTVQ